MIKKINHNREQKVRRTENDRLHEVQYNIQSYVGKTPLHINK